METSCQVRHVAMAVTVSMAAVLAGCTTLSGSTFDYENVDKSKPLTGVPFTINKPAPTIVRTPGADGLPDKYSVAYSYVADPKGSYTLQISPGLLSSVDFSMSFDIGGSLQETSAKATDQAGPLLQSLGKLALAGAALDKATGDTKADTQDSIDIQWIKVRGQKFLGDAASRIFDAASPSGRPVNPADRLAFQDAISRAEGLAKLNKVKKEFFYASDQEYVVLRALYALAKAEVGTSIDTTTAETRLTSSDTTVPGALLISEVKDAVRKGNLKVINRKKAELVAALQTERAQAEAKNWTGEDKSKSILERLKFLKEVAALFPRPLQLLSDMTDMAPAEWQRRVIADLNVQLLAAEHEHRVLQSDVVPNQTLINASKARITGLQARKMSVLGVAQEHARRLEIARRLATTGESRSLKLLREERDELDGIIAAAETALKPKAKEVKADEAIMAHHFNVTTPLDSAGVIAKLENEQAGARPKYIVVTRRILSSTPPIAPPGGGVAGGTGTGASSDSGTRKTDESGSGESATVPTVKK